MLLPSVDIIIVNYNAGALLRQCVESALASTAVQVRCLVVDNASTDDSLQQLLQLMPEGEQLRLIRNKRNLGFATAVNQGVAAGASEWFLLLNPDAQLPSDGLCSLLSTAQILGDAGLLGPVLLNPDGSEQRGARRDLPTPLDALLQGLQLHRVWPKLDFNHTSRPLPDEPARVPAISGACMLVRRQAHQQLSGFDDEYFLHFEDLDYCARMGAEGYGIYFVPSVAVIHAQGGCSQGAESRVGQHKAAGMRRFFARHPAGQSWLLPLLNGLIWVRQRLGAGR